MAQTHKKSISFVHVISGVQMAGVMNGCCCGNTRKREVSIVHVVQNLSCKQVAVDTTMRHGRLKHSQSGQGLRNAIELQTIDYSSS